MTIKFESYKTGAGGGGVTSVNGDTGPAVTLTTSNVAEGSNLYYTNARFDTQLATKSTSDVAEGSNLYYTNARFDTQLATKSTSDLAEGSNLYYTNARFDTQLATKDTSDVAEGSNLYYTNARFDTQLATKDTSDVAEGSNLYYTNARADARIAAANLTDLNDVNYTAGAGIDGQFLKYVHANNRWEAAAGGGGVTSVNGDTGPAVTLTTSNVAEGSNLYYTNARFDTQLATKDTSDVAEGSNLYYTNARFDTQLATKDTSDVAEGSNLYYTNTRADARIAAANLTDLNDVNYTAGSSINNYVLKYVHANNRWEAAAESAGGGGVLTYTAVAVGDSPVTGAVSTHYSANTSGGVVNIALPAIAAGNAGNEIRVKLKTAGNNLTLTPDGTNTVEGGGAGSAYTLSVQNQSVTLVSDGTSNWEII